MGSLVRFRASHPRFERSVSAAGTVGILIEFSRRMVGQNLIRLSIIGASNCAASLVQGVHYYRNADISGSIPSLMHVEFGKYHGVCIFAR